MTERGRAAPAAENPMRTGGCAGWLYTDAIDGPVIGGRRNVCCREFFVGKDDWTCAIPVPLRNTGLLTATAGDGQLCLDLSSLPERPQDNVEPENPEQQFAKVVLDRVKSVWARLRDVEAALGDPERIWLRLTELWLGEERRRHWNGRHCEAAGSCWGRRWTCSISCTAPHPPSHQAAGAAVARAGEHEHAV